MPLWLHTYPTIARGSAFGLLAATQSFGNLAAFAVAGIISTAVGPALAFACVAAWMIIAEGLLATMRRI